MCLQDNGAPGAPWGYMENALERDGVAALERQLRLQADLIDSLDEELELELDDRRLDGEDTSDEDWRANRQRYFRELLRLQGELVKLQDWVVHSGHRLVVLFEGRDAAGKRRHQAHHAAPESARMPRGRAAGADLARAHAMVFPALCGASTRRGRNRAVRPQLVQPRGRGAGHGLCNDAEYEEFFRSAPEFEKMLARSGIQIIKYWFSVSDNEQEARFESRINDPLKQWKLSPMDLESRRRWEAYTQAKEVMLERTHIPESPWWIVRADDKKRPA